MRADRLVWLVALLFGVAPALAESAIEAIERALPPGARETVRVTDPPGPHGIAIGPAGPMAPPPDRTQRGIRLRIAWSWPAGDVDSRETGFADALKAVGFAPVFACATEACGGFDFRLALPVLPLPDMVVDLGDFRYRALARDDPPALAALLVSRGPTTTHAQLTLVTPAAVPQAVPEPPEAPATPKPAVTDDLATRLAATGRAVLEGVAFATGGTALAQDDTGTLAALVTYLGADPARRVALVGHTDWTGSPDTNLALSRARAEAVAAALEEMGANPVQITVAGVGPFAPRASNTDPAGLAANRRVEVVLLPSAR